MVNQTTTRLVLLALTFSTILHSFVPFICVNHELAALSDKSTSLQSVQHPSKSVQIKTQDPQQSRNLVAFTALGSGAAIAMVHYNVFAHFLDWDCIIFVHANEIAVPSKEARMQEIARRCSIVRLPGVFWTHFLMTLTPELTRNYQHIAIVLDDVLAPTHGDSPVNVSKLLQTMQEHNLSSISPSIKGAFWKATQPQPRRCLWQTQHIETFFQIFSRELFQCWRSYMEYSNPQGFCLDLCLDQQLCPSLSRLAVDSNMTAYHLGRQKNLTSFVPESALVGTNLSSGMHRRVPKKVVMEGWGMCGTYNCPKVEKEVATPKIMECATK